MARHERWKESALKLGYRPALDPDGRGNHYQWELGCGFGMRLYRSGLRTCMVPRRSGP